MRTVLADRLMADPVAQQALAGFLEGRGVPPTASFRLEVAGARLHPIMQDTGAAVTDAPAPNGEVKEPHA